jgi:hypothetical protein
MTRRLRDNIPAELRALRQWVVWRWEARDGKPTKVPIRPVDLRLASATDPAGWTDFATATGRKDRNHTLSGIGFVVTPDDPFLGVDLDGCRTDGAVEPWAQAIVDRLDSYAEVTPSGTGLRVWIGAKLPGEHNRKGRIEMYDHARYFTVTGRHLEGTPTTIEPRQDAVNGLCAELWPPVPTPAPPAVLARPQVSRTAADVDGLARQAANGGRWARLMAGDLSDYGGDHSRADAALCAMAAFYTPDPSVIDELVRSSGLMRPKWDRADYRERTIAGALAVTTETYTPPSPSRVERPSVPKPEDEPEPERRLPAPDPADPTWHGLDDEKDGPITPEPARHVNSIPVTGKADVDAAPATPIQDHGGLAEVPDFPLDVLPGPARALVRAAVEAGLPAALAAGAALAAMATAVGPKASIEAQPGWSERGILWLPLLAPRGAGKSPTQELAFRPIRDRDAQLWSGYRDGIRTWQGAPRKERGRRPADPSVLAGDTTLEALARRLEDAEGLAVEVDELSQWLRGVGEYKRAGGSGDRGRLLSLWTGHPWRYSRVGVGPAGIDILVAHPTVVICGGLQPTLHGLLGGEEDGLRPRWLPHLATLPDQQSDVAGGTPEAWLRLLGADLLPIRDASRRWMLDPKARERFRSWQRRWKAEARGSENASVSAALVKADVHLLRVALVYAEAEWPGQPRAVPGWLMDRAAGHVQFTLDCWRALPESGSLALSIRTERLDKAVDRTRDWLEQHGGEATRRELMRAGVGGVQTAVELDAVLARYESRYAGTLAERRPPGGGPTAYVVRAPKRIPHLVVSTDNGPGESFSRPEVDPEYETATEDPPTEAPTGTDNGLLTTDLLTTAEGSPARPVDEVQTVVSTDNGTPEDEQLTPPWVGLDGDQDDAEGDPPWAGLGIELADDLPDAESDADPEDRPNRFEQIGGSDWKPIPELEAWRQRHEGEKR